MTDESIREIMNQKKTPAGRILMWAFNVSCDTHDILIEKIPQIEAYPNGRGLGNFLQIGTIIATLMHIERHHGAPDYTRLHQDIVQNIAPSMRDKYLPILQELSCYLLKSDMATARTDEIPSLNILFNEEGGDIALCIGTWLVSKLKKEMPSDDFDMKLIGILGKLVYIDHAQQVILFGNLLDEDIKSLIT